MIKGAIIGILAVLFLVSLFGVVSAEKGQWGASVPITKIDLTEQGNNYNMKPGRLTFEFDKKLYAIQVRKVKQEYVDFLIMTLDMDKQEDITAYILDDSFSLKSDEKKEIDLDNDGISDLFIELNEIIPTGKYNSIRSADFSIKKINTQPIIVNENTEMKTEIIRLDETIKNEIQDQISEPVIALDQKSKEQLIFLDKIINFFKNLF